MELQLFVYTSIWYVINVWNGVNVTRYKQRKKNTLLLLDRHYFEHDICLSLNQHLKFMKNQRNIK